MNNPYNIGIKTRRTNNLFPSYQIVYEWEDCIAEQLGCEIRHYIKSRYANMIIRRLERPISFLYKQWYAKDIGKPHKPQKNYFLSFEPSPFIKEVRCNRPNIIPIIIDFCMYKQEIPLFEKTFSRAPFVIVTSKEALEFLQKNNCRLKTYHLPLTLPNKYTLKKEGWINRPYDIVLAGRQSPILSDYFEKYCSNNPQIKYLKPVFEKGNINYYSNDGAFVDSVWNRNKYWEVLEMGKMAFYSTPGIDGPKDRQIKGFSQVTPRLLELMAAGCNIMTRYNENPDTKYHELSRYFKNVRTYEDFEREMNRCLNTPPEYDLYQEYLEKHYTSTLVPMLEDIFSDYKERENFQLH